MSKAEFITAIQTANGDYDASEKDLEAKQTYLSTVEGATKEFTEATGFPTTQGWPC